MSIDYGDMERQFLATLKADTGRALDEWMAAIAAEQLHQRNDIIDWLRRQGFMFSKASWLERIHNNGGKPIYGEADSRMARSRPERAVEPRLPRTAPALPEAAAPPRVSSPATQPPAPQPSAPAPSAAQPPASPSTPADADTQAAIDALLAKAKAYRPLAAFVTTEIRKAYPDSTVEPRDGYLAFARAGRPFAVLIVSAKELRLALALQDHSAPQPLVPAKLPATVQVPTMTHAVALTDARQITPALRDAIRAAGSVA